MRNIYSANFPANTSSPFSVAEPDSVIFTITKSPIRCLPRSKTTTRFCSVRPNMVAAAYHTLYQHFVGLPHTTGVGLGGKTVLKGDDFVQTADFHLFGHIVGQVLAGIRAGTLGIFEHEGCIVSALFHQRKRKPVFLRFGMEAREDVGRQTATGMMRRMAATSPVIPTTVKVRFISFCDAAAPLCTGRCMCLHTLGTSAMTCKVSSLNVLGVRW